MAQQEEAAPATQPAPADMPEKDTLRKIVFLLAAVACLTPWVSPPIALLLGLGVALSLGHPYPQYNKKATNYLLKTSVVGLGFGMNFQTAMQAGSQGILFTVVSILGTCLLGYGLSRLLRLDAKTSYLISSGTAICGGSAIAAVAPVIQAEDRQVSVALGIVFILNSVALLIFPVIGHALALSQGQFGMWAAIAIHDTSSVVGAASRYGAEALGIATTVKLVRALWIIPLALASAFIFRSPSKQINIPWFIGLFVVAMLLFTYVGVVHTYGPYVVEVARKGLTLTLFLIGAGLSRKVIKSVGAKPFLLGALLWVAISVTSLVAVMQMVR